MGIKSTVDILREDAINRIEKICALIDDQDYRELEQCSFDPHEDLEEFVNIGHDDISIDRLHKYTNTMLGRILDRPFYRKSMFDNYNVIDSFDELD